MPPATACVDLRMTWHASVWKTPKAVQPAEPGAAKGQHTSVRRIASSATWSVHLRGTMADAESSGKKRKRSDAKLLSSSEGNAKMSAAEKERLQRFGLPYCFTGRRSSLSTSRSQALPDRTLPRKEVNAANPANASRCVHPTRSGHDVAAPGEGAGRSSLDCAAPPGPLARPGRWSGARARRVRGFRSISR